MMADTMPPGACEAYGMAGECGAERLSLILVNLYVAIKRIHASLDREEVITAIKDVITNQIGSEDFALFERGGDDAPFSLSTSVGDSGARMPHPHVIEEVLSSGAVYLRNVAIGDPPDAPVACVPLKLGERVTGIIAIQSLLCHKERLDLLDFELCDLLATHAGHALYACSLHERSKMAEAG